MRTLHDDYDRALDYCIYDSLLDQQMRLHPTQQITSAQIFPVTDVPVTDGSTVEVDLEKKYKEQSKKVEVLELAVEKLITMNNDLRSDLNKSTRYFIDRLNKMEKLKEDTSCDSLIVNIRPTDTPYLSGKNYYDTP